MLEYWSLPDNGGDSSFLFRGICLLLHPGLYAEFTDCMYTPPTLPNIFPSHSSTVIDLQIAQSLKSLVGFSTYILKI